MTITTSAEPTYPQSPRRSAGSRLRLSGGLAAVAQ